MNDMKQSHQSQGGPESGSDQKGHRPYWKRAHHDWRFWVALLLMLTAISIYIMSENFSMWPRSRPQPPMSGILGK